MNSLLGWIGLSLLVFVAAFAVGRLNRPAVAVRPPDRVASVRVNEARPAAQASLNSVAAEEPTRPAARTSAAEANASPAADELPATALAAKPAPTDAGAPSPRVLAAQRRATERRVAIAARRAHAAQIPADFRRYYAQELPADAISEEQEVQATVGGEAADVITLSSPAFNAINKDFVLLQVRRELMELEFKRVYITNGKGFKTSVGL